MPSCASHPDVQSGIWTTPPKVIEDAFIRHGEIYELRIGGRVIRVTPEHPLFVEGRGWTPAGEVVAGDMLSTLSLPATTSAARTVARIASTEGADTSWRMDDARTATLDAGEWLEVESNQSTGEFDTVYNFRVADHHTYFVGTPTWGFGVWVHNSYRKPVGTQLGHTYPAEATDFASRKSYRKAVAEGAFSSHGGKHIQARTIDEAIQFSRVGNAQYLPGLSNRGLEKMTLQKGFVVPHGNGFHVYAQFDGIVGYNSGRATSWIRSELFGGTYHGHPFLESNLPKSVRSYFGI